MTLILTKECPFLGNQLGKEWSVFHKKVNSHHSLQKKATTSNYSQFCRRKEFFAIVNFVFCLFPINEPWTFSSWLKRVVEKLNETDFFCFHCHLITAFYRKFRKWCSNIILIGNNNYATVLQMMTRSHYFLFLCQIW